MTSTFRQPPLFAGLTCTRCGADHTADRPRSVCERPGCGRPLAARYALEPRPRPTPAELTSRRHDIWRFPELMPIDARTRVVSLGEGWTPLVEAASLGRSGGLERVLIKDESGNPTGSFKARGLAAAVTKAAELGAAKVAVPTAGNAGGAAAAYAARAGIGCVVVMPSDTPPIFKQEVRAFGADLVEHDGLIDECGAIVAEGVAREGWYDVSTLKEPYRVEGKKSLGTEIAEQLGWELPDVVICPTGGGTGLIGMWKAWAELEALGWIGPRRPRMYVVQPAGCAPVVRAFERGAARCERFEGAATSAAGLRVPRPFADEWILAVLGRSRGGAVTVEEDEIRAGALAIARLEGIFPAPEGGAAWAGLKRLVARGDVRPDERVVVVNTGSGYKYL